MEASIYFTTSGHLYVQLIEVIDLLEAVNGAASFFTVFKKKVKERHLVHVEVKIINTKRKEIQKVRTGTKLINPGENLNVGEDFVFESISSAYTIVVSLHLTTIANGETTQKIMGLATIPIDRLEENTKIVQWYQMINPVTGEGIRTAIRIKCLFNTERSQTFSKPNFPAAFTRRDSSATAAAAGGGLRRTVSGRSEEFGLDRQEDFNISRHATELLTRISDADVPVPNDTESPHSQAKNSDLEPSKLMLELSLSDMNETARRVLVAAPADDSEQEDHEEDEPQLVCGLVDYCVVLGPSSAYTMRPTHQITEKGELQRLNLSSDQISLYQATISSPTESTADHLFSPVSALSPTGFEGNQKSVNMGLFSPVNTTEMTMWLQNEDLECKVWDRLPKEDHEDIELPSKIEWFACPEGCMTVIHAERPKALYRSFALCAAESEEVYGVSVTFFVRTSEELEDNILSVFANSSESEEDKADNDEVPWHQPYTSDDDSVDDTFSRRSFSPTNQSRSHPKKYVWVSTCVCLLFRSPYFQQISRCLELAFQASILPQLQRWEENRTQMIRNYGMMSDSALLPSYFYMSQQMQLWRQFPACHLTMENLFATLCLEHPLPILNLLSLTLELPLGESAESNDEKERIKFEAYDAQSLPKLSYSLAHVLQLFGARGMIDILCCVLSESRMMFHSADVSKLTIICEGFRSLIYPFTWTHVYLPVVPVQLMNLVEAPVPYMLGTHSENMRQIQPQYLQEMVTINCDTGSIQKNGVTILQFPEKEDRWLVTALTHLSLPSALHEDGRALRAPIDRLQHQAFTPTEKPIATDTTSHMSKVSMDLKIQIMIFDVLVQFLRYIPDCLFYLNPNCPVFNRPLFMTEYASEEYRDMLEILTVTNAFHTVTESMNSPHLTFFADCIQRITEAETKLISQMTDQNFNVKSPEYFTRPFGDIPEPDEDEGMTNNLTTASSHSLRTPRMQSFSRSLSVANIIYDKIGNSATKDASSVSSNTSYSLQRAFSFRNPSSAIKKTPSEGSGVSSPSNNHRMHQSKSSISLLKSASLFNMDISSPNRNPVQQQKYTVHMLNDRLYDSFLPNWVLRKSEICAPTAAVSPRADFKVTLTINTKFGQEEEVEAYGISALVEHRLQLYIPFLESNTDKSMELVLPIQYTCVNDIDYSIEPNQPSNVEGEENESAKSSSTINFSPGKPLASPQVDAQSEHSDSGRKSKVVAEEDCPLLYFNRDYVVQAQKSVKHWDIAALSEYFHISESEMTVLFRENPHSLMYDSSTPHHVVGNSTSPSTQRPIATSANCNRLNQRNILSRAMSSQQNTHTFNKLTGSTGHHGHMVTVDEAITDFLQKIMVYTNLDANYIDTAMEKCLYAFQMQENRTGFLTILKQAKKQQEDSKSSSAGNHMMANIYPLHDSTFDAFSQLFDGMLSICSQHEDFITAFELLEVGGHYFRILPEQLQRLEQLLQQSTAVPDEEFEEDIIEFLSEKACHHPIYQMPNFWKALMHHRLPISTLKTNEHLKVYAASSTVRSGGKLNKVGVNLVMTEVRSILYMMLGMGVNSSRALSFIQAIATDYYLALDDYFKLQRFSTRLWAQHEGENLPLKTPSSDRISPGNIISSHTAANLQSQTSAASISNMPSGSRKVSRMSSGFREGRRNSINIGDLMTRQGHGEKLSTVKSKEDGMDSATIFYTNTNDSADNVILSNGSFELLSSMTPSTTGTGGGIFSPSTFRGLSTMFSPSLDPIHTESNSEQSFGDSLTPPRSPYIHQNSGPVVTPRNKTQGFIFDEPLALDSANLSRASSIVRTNINEGNEHVNHRHNSIDNGSLSRMRQQIVNVENLEEDRSNSGKHSYPDDTYYDSMLDAGLDNTLFEAKDIKGLEQGSKASTTATKFDSVNNWLIIGGDDGSIQLVDLKSYSLHSKLKHSVSTNESYEGITCLHSIPVACGANNEYMFFSGCSNGVVKCWNLPTTNSSSKTSTSLVISKDSGSLATNVSPGTNSSPSVWSSRSRFKQSCLTIKTHSAPITKIASHAFHNGSYLSWLVASADKKGGVTVVRYDGNDAVATTTNNNSNLSTLFSQVSSPSSQSQAVTAMTFVSNLATSSPTTDIMRMSTGDPWLAIGTASGAISVIDIATNTPLFQAEGHSAQVSKIVSIKPNEFLTCSYDRSIKIWDIRMKNRVASTNTSLHSMLGYGNTGGTLNTSSGSRIFGERSLGKSQTRRCAMAPITEVVAGGWNNSLIISASADGMLRMWDLRYDLQIPCTTIRAHTNRISSIVWDGRKEFYTSSFDGSVKTWDSINGKSTSSFRAYGSPVNFNDTASVAATSIHGSAGAFTDLSQLEAVTSMTKSDFHYSQEDNTVDSNGGGQSNTSTPERKRSVGRNQGSKQIWKSRSIIATTSLLGEVKVFAYDSNT